MSGSTIEIAFPGWYFSCNWNTISTTKPGQTLKIYINYKFIFLNYIHKNYHNIKHKFNLLATWSNHFKQGKIPIRKKERNSKGFVIHHFLDVLI